MTATQGGKYDTDEGVHYLVRDLDTLPCVVHADELFDGIVEVDGRS